MVGNCIASLLSQFSNHSLASMHVHVISVFESCTVNNKCLEVRGCGHVTLAAAVDYNLNILI